MEKLLRSSRFSGFASRLCSILSIPVKAATLDAVAEKYPELNEAEFGYETRTDEEMFSSYAATIEEYASSFLVIHKLTSSTDLLTMEVVMSCEKDEFADLKNAIADLAHGKDEEESEEEEVARDGENAAEKQTEVPEQGHTSG